LTSESSFWLEFVVSLLLGSGALVLGVLLRAGKLRSRFEWYFDPTMPRVLRHLPFAVIPFGLMFLAGAVAFSATLVDGDALLVVLAAIPAALIAFIVGAVFVLRPPAWMKPAWIREIETGEAGAGGVRATAMRPDSGLFGASLVARSLAWTGLALVVALYLLLDLPNVILPGVGMAALLLAFAGRRRRSDPPNAPSGQDIRQ
jgi:hypothetical protein